LESTVSDFLGHCWLTQQTMVKIWRVGLYGLSLQ
jgi:hypothetical protein